MQKKTKVLFGIGLAASIAAGLAFATPTIGAFYNVVLSTGTAERDIHAHAHLAIPGMDEDSSAVLVTEGASNIIQQEIKFSPEEACAIPFVGERQLPQGATGG